MAIGAPWLAAVVVVALCSGDERWDSYKNDRVGFQLEYPKAWTIVDEPYASSIRFSPPAEDGRFSGFTIGPAEPIRDSWFTDFNAWVRTFKRRLAASGARIMREERLTVSSSPAIRLGYKAGLPGAPELVDILIGVQGRPYGQVFRFVYAPPASVRHRQTQEALFGRILSTLRITPTP